jgi:hypothetical protein
MLFLACYAVNVVGRFIPPTKKRGVPRSEGVKASLVQIRHSSIAIFFALQQRKFRTHLLLQEKEGIARCDCGNERATLTVTADFCIMLFCLRKQITGEIMLLRHFRVAVGKVLDISLHYMYIIIAGR